MTIANRFRLMRQIGEGGMGSVWLATHLGLGIPCAIKFVEGEWRRQPEMVARFEREAKVEAQLRSPHVVHVLDHGVWNGTPYIAMEFLVGGDLKELSDCLGALDGHLALRIVGQACAGLQKAHESGIVHRDIKPANLFLARQPDGEIIVKVLDFGIAKLPSKLLSGDDALSTTTAGRLLGSPLFMSPEQIRGLRTLNHRTDIWSLGAVLYQALAGRAPFAECETVGQLMVAICSQEPPSLEQVAPWVRAEAAAIVQRALKSEADERYPSAQDMLDDILALMPSGTEIQESQLVNASGEPAPALWYDDPSSAPGTQSLDDNERFLVEPPSPRSNGLESPKPRTGPPPHSDSTMPSASDGFRHPSGGPSKRGGTKWVAPVALLAGAALAGGVWWAQRSDGTTAPAHVEPANATPEGRASASKVEEAPPREPAVAVDPVAVGIDAGARAQVGVIDHAVVSAKDRRRRTTPIASSNATPLVASAPAAAVTPAASPPASPMVTATPPPTPPVVKEAEPQAPESPWKLDRKFPAKNGAP